MPQDPNYNRGTGRLATDRFDFEKHINGSDFNHEGAKIFLSPSVLIDGYAKNNVRDAIVALNNVVSPPIIQDATSSVKGILKLTHDLSGTASLPVVVGIQSQPVSSLIPSIGQVLKWDGAAWEASNEGNVFLANGDLYGDNIFQFVSSIAGFAGTVQVKSTNLTWLSSLTPKITQSDSFASPSDFTIQAQSTGGVNLPGGNLILTGGLKNGTGLRGGVKLKMNAGGDTMMQLVEPIASQKVIGLLKNGNITSAEMPAGTGDMVMYIADTVTPPTSGNPVNGVILYSESGELKFKQPNGSVTALGSIPNPSIWGAAGAQSYSKQYSFATTNGVVSTAVTFPLDDNTTTKLDVLVVARRADTAAQSAHFNLSMGYVRFSAGSPQAIGTVTSSDPRSTSGASTWSATINTSGNSAIIQVTGETGKNINWFIILQAVAKS